MTCALHKALFFSSQVRPPTPLHFFKDPILFLSAKQFDHMAWDLSFLDQGSNLARIGGEDSSPPDPRGMPTPSSDAVSQPHCSSEG